MVINGGSPRESDGRDQENHVEMPCENDWRPHFNKKKKVIDKRTPSRRHVNRENEAKRSESI